MDAPATEAKPCCVCAAQNGKHCAKCKSRHYCSKACQVACRQLAADFQDTLMPKIKKEPAIVEGVSPAGGAKAAARAVRTGTTKDAKASALNDDAPSWRGTCAVCLDLLPVEDCCQKSMRYDTRCPLCRAPVYKSDAEWVQRLQKHADEGRALEQFVLANKCSSGTAGLKQDFKRALQLYQLAAAQGNPMAQASLGCRFQFGQGVEIDYEAAAVWYRRAADQGFAEAQLNMGKKSNSGQGVAQSYEEAVKWYHLAAAQGHADALYALGGCYADARGGADNAAFAIVKLEAMMRALARAR
ncbi:hypothetical protein M885DRAFT_562195 [Pelagophyceae sp. CCMP2097]|nr:hypothetical protein M885DRAFT_562195 [Pelagophyceae sp. CCMP2097]